MKLSKSPSSSHGGCGLFCMPKFPFVGTSKPKTNKGKEPEKTDAEETKEQVAEPEDDDLLTDEFEQALREDSKVGEEGDDFQQIPPEATLNDLYKVQVLDKNRAKTYVKTLVQSKEHRRHIVIFIRHFFCGMCYSYVKMLTEQIPPEKLAKMNPPTTLSIIGCGDPILIPQYLKATDCPFEIYADPSRSLYKKLGFAISNAANPEPPEYVKKHATSFMRNLWISLGFAARTGKVSGGMISQNGGEMIWIDGQLQFIHRMKNSTDHTEVYELLRVLKRQGIEQGRKTPSIMSNNDDAGSKRSSWARYAGKRLSAIFGSDSGE